MVEELDEEEEEEEMERDEKTSNPGSTSSSPRSPSSSQKRPASSTSSYSSLPSDPPRKKTRDLPNLSHCHSCGVRFPAKGRRDTLQTLRSQWRVVLLCQKCLQSIRSAAVCSYCFSGFLKGGEGFIDCRECSCRVHLACVPVQRGYTVPSELNPGMFACVDCRALPIFPGRNPSDFEDDVFSARISRVSLQEMARGANSCCVLNKVEAAARANEKAMVKAESARCAAELAKKALDLFVLAAKDPSSDAELVVPDEKFALQLHRAINGSARISRNQCLVNSECLDDLERGHTNGNSVGMESESGSYSVCGRVELGNENKPFEIREPVDSEPLVCNGQLGGDFSLRLCAMERNYQRKGVAEHGKDNSAEMPLKEEQASCSNKIVNSSGDDNSVDSFPASCQKLNQSIAAVGMSKDSEGADGGDLTPIEQQKRHTVSDRYLKKYIKRCFKTESDK